MGEVFEKVKKLNLPLGKYVVLAGSALEGFGVRKSEDIDILVTTDIYKKLRKEKGWKEQEFKDGKKIIAKDDYEISDTFYVKGKYEPSPEHLIKNSKVIKGIPFMNLHEVLKYKKALKREKDLRDIELIEKYLEGK